MSELRQNTLTGEWVVIAAERAKRPHSFARSEKQVGSDPVSDCPFCPGNEERTPPEVSAVRPGRGPANTEGWLVRVVPNKYPAFNAVSGAPSSIDPLRPVLPGRGVHEVIIHGPDHDKSLGQSATEEITRIFSVYQERLRAASSRPGLEAAVIIVNHGAEAGASISHPHSQLFAVPVLPTYLAREMRQMGEYADKSGSCLLCDLWESEVRLGARMIFENDFVAVFCQFASGVPFETYLVPKEHVAEFSEASPEALRGAAEGLRAVLSKLHAGLGDIPYNIYLHTRPFHSESAFHWHLSILPKTSIIAGFEYATGIMINVVAPESAAEFLRVFS